MKEQKSTKKIIYLIIAIIIIIGAIVCKAKGFNVELIYSNRQQISISNSTELDTNKIEEISKSILAGRKVKVQELERFGNAVQIISESISDEEKQNLINKINEECGTDISNDDTKIVTVSNTRIRDILKPYILPSIITFVAVLLYFLIMYHKIGVSKVLLKGVFTPIITELVYYSLIAITRVEFGRITNAIAIGIYILAIGAITNVALAISKEPKIVDRIEIVWLGGHSFLSKDNKEFNFKQDVQAVRNVFESKVKLTIIPCKNVASNLRTSIYELEHFLKGKSELCDYLCQRFYNDGVHGIQERRVIWDISVIAYMINKEWFDTEEVSCPNINNDTSYELTTKNHKITVVNYLNVDKIYRDLFEKLGV